MSFLMYPRCILDVASMYPRCILDVSSMATFRGDEKIYRLCASLRWHGNYEKIYRIPVFTGPTRLKGCFKGIRFFREERCHVVTMSQFTSEWSLTTVRRRLESLRISDRADRVRSARTLRHHRHRHPLVPVVRSEVQGRLATLELLALANVTSLGRVAQGPGQNRESRGRWPREREKTPSPPNTGVYRSRRGSRTCSISGKSGVT